MIKVFEIWTPDATGARLELNTSYCGSLESFKAASADVTFAPGVGLPGQVWQSQRPVLIEDLSDQARFVRAAAAVATGLTTGLGIPMLDGDVVRAIVTLLCGSGVVEIWTPNADGTALELRAGSYQGAEAFGALSRSMTFAPGQGLPGQVWATKAPLILPDLATSAAFARREAAATAGLCAGLGIPVLHGDQVVDVVVLLSTSALPLAQVFEIWAPDTSQLALALQEGYYGDLENFQAVSAATTFTRGEGLPGRVWATKGPVILRGLSNPEEFMRAEAAAIAGLAAGLSIPVLANGEVKATVVILN